VPERQCWQCGSAVGTGLTAWPFLCQRIYHTCIYSGHPNPDSAAGYYSGAAADLILAGYASLGCHACA